MDIKQRETVQNMILGKRPDEIKRMLSALKKDTRSNRIRGYHNIVKINTVLIEGLEGVLKAFSPKDKGRKHKSNNINQNMSEVFKCQKCGKEEKVAKISRFRKYCSECRDIVKEERKKKRRELKKKGTKEKK